MQIPFTATQVLNIGTELSLRQCITKFRSQQQIELELGSSDPYVCFIPDQHLAYFANQPGFALGACVVKHFQNLADFVWVEQTIEDGEECWLACRVELNRPLVEYIGPDLASFTSILKDGSPFSQVVSSVAPSKIRKLTALFPDCELIKLEQSALGSMASSQYQLILLQELIVRFETKLNTRVKLVVGFGVIGLLLVLVWLFFSVTSTSLVPSLPVPQMSEPANVTELPSNPTDELLPQPALITTGEALNELFDIHFEDIYQALTLSEQGVVVQANQNGITTNRKKTTQWLEVPVLEQVSADCNFNTEWITLVSPFIYDQTSNTISIKQPVELFWVKRLLQLCDVVNESLVLLTMVVNADLMLEQFELKTAKISN